MNYHLSSKARLDLINIWEFTKNTWSVSQADNYYQSIVDKFRDICSRPEMGKSYNELRSGYRGVRIKSHVIFYRVSNQQSIEIVRILHQRMEYKNRLDN